MEDYRKLWDECLAVIRERVVSRENGERTYNVWFADISIENYDGDTVILRVPSKYVYEYLEMYCTRLLSEVLTAHFGPSTRLSYRVGVEPTFEQAASVLKAETPDGGIPQFAIQNARKRLEDGLHYFLGDKAVWLPCYEKVADWLTDNKGRGLLCVGTTGLGKSLICRKIFTVLFGSKAVFCTAKEMNDRIDALLKPDARIIMIDDLGKEPVSVYGRRPFFELCDAAERDGRLLIINTSLSTTPFDRTIYPNSIQERYGNDVLDRLKAITKVVVFKGDSLRPKKG